MGVRDDLLAIPDADLRSGNVAAAVLVWMDFATGAKRWWSGFGDLTHAGHTWQGLGDLISISEIGAGFGTDSEGLQFGLAATAEMMALVQAGSTAVRGRQVVVYDQLFLVNPSDGTQPWQPMGAPIALFSGTMQPLTYSAKGATERAIQLTAENVFVRRNAPPQGQLTDADQRARSAADRGLERVDLYQNYQTRWI
jgi:hypothetical protein